MHKYGRRFENIRGALARRTVKQFTSTTRRPKQFKFLIEQEFVTRFGPNPAGLSLNRRAGGLSVFKEGHIENVMEFLKMK